MPEDPKDVFRRISANRKRERWCFTDSELERPQDCDSGDPFVARINSDVFVQMEPNLEEQGVIMLRNGKLTDRWEDGTLGVPETIAQYAREVDVLEKPVYLGHNQAQGDDDYEAATWRYVFVSADGHFEAWAPGPAVEAEDPKALFQKVTRGHHEERWCFTAYELSGHERTCHNYDEFVADLGEDQQGPISEVGVIVYRNGDVSNRWGDGTRGVPDEYRQLADEVEALTKPYGEGEADVYADEWRDVIADKDGGFVAWAPKKARQVIDDELPDHN